MISRYFVYFIIYSFLGWIYETCYCTIKEKAWNNRGFLYGPCIPLYGTGATLAQIIFVERPFGESLSTNNINIFLVCAIGSFILEYSTSYFLEKRFHARWWDYSKMPLNIKGRVCLIFTACFGIAGVVIVNYLIPPIMNSMNHIPGFVMEIFALIFMFIFGMDMALTVSALTSFAKDFERITDEFNENMAARVANIYEELSDYKLASIEKANERKEEMQSKKELTAEKLAEIREQLSSEAVKNWIAKATETQRGQFRHIAKFTHPVENTKSLLEKGSSYLRNHKK
ncbi:MAG: putative ABC transporter permease [Pseudobutyrivibrio sp.]|nr:putative ABC transporter permease [Pseudobutyrivibrio sp.]